MKYLIIFVGVLLLFSTVSASNFIAGVGSDVTMYNTYELDAIPVQFYGVSFDTETEGVFGFLLPDEVYTVVTYGWVEENQKDVNFFSTDLEGRWYFTQLENSPWRPFFTAIAGMELEDTEYDEKLGLNGCMGLGTELAIDNNWGIFTTHRVKMGERIFYQGSIGLYFGL